MLLNPGKSNVTLYIVKFKVLRPGYCWSVKLDNCLLQQPERSLPSGDAYRRQVLLQEGSQSVEFLKLQSDQQMLLHYIFPF